MKPITAMVTLGLVLLLVLFASRFPAVMNTSSTPHTTTATAAKATTSLPGRQPKPMKSPADKTARIGGIWFW